MKLISRANNRIDRGWRLMEGASHPSEAESLTHGDYFSSDRCADHCGCRRDLFLGHRPLCTGGRPTQTAAQASCRASLPWRHSAEVARTNVLDRQQI